MVPVGIVLMLVLASSMVGIIACVIISAYEPEIEAFIDRIDQLGKRLRTWLRGPDPA